MTSGARQSSLDGVRALAVLAVMGLHTDDRLFSGGFYGVDVFFVLSAFLISTLLKQEIADGGGRLDLLAFYGRRATRLLPALFAWLAFVALPTSIVAGESDKVIESTFASLFYYGNYLMAFDVQAVGSAYSHIWSLAIEEQFYFVWPVTLLAVSRRLSETAMRRAVLLALPVVLALYGLSEQALGGGTNYFLPTGHLFAIACGLAAAEVAPGVRGRAWIRIAVPGGLGLYIALVCGFRWLPHGTLTKTVGLAALSIAVSAIILATTNKPSRLLSSAPLVWIGRRSYGLYLYHRTLAVLVPALVPGITLKIDAPIVLILSLVVTEASWRFVEQPASVWGRARIAARRRGSAAGVSEKSSCD